MFTLIVWSSSMLIKRSGKYAKCYIIC